MKRFITTLLLALRVRPSVRFARRQWREVPGTYEYKVRFTGREISIRHDTDEPYALATSAMLALDLRPTLRFAWRQARSRPGIHEYTLRESGRRILIRHDTDDPYVLAECFGRLGGYEPPERVAAVLADRPPRHILDLGGNIGLFGLLALERYPGSEVVAVEADPANADIHQRVIDANELGDRWQLIRGFAAAAAGEKVRFAAGLSSRSREATGDDTDVVEVKTIDAFEQLAGADLIKIDIEGGEWQLLGDARFRELGAAAIVLEYHGNGCPGDDPRAAAEAALHAAGYETEVVHESADQALDPFEGQGTVWGWEPA